MVFYKVGPICYHRYKRSWKTPINWSNKWVTGAISPEKHMQWWAAGYTLWEYLKKWLFLESFILSELGLFREAWREKINTTPFTLLRHPLSSPPLSNPSVFSFICKYHEQESWLTTTWLGWKFVSMLVDPPFFHFLRVWSKSKNITGWSCFFRCF